MTEQEGVLVAQETKISKRFMLRWHNWNCDHVRYHEELYPNYAYGYPLDTEPYAWIVHMYINFHKNYATYISSWLVPFKRKCNK